MKSSIPSWILIIVIITGPLLGFVAGVMLTERNEEEDSSPEGQVHLPVEGSQAAGRTLGQNGNTSRPTWGSTTSQDGREGDGYTNQLGEGSGPLSEYQLLSRLQDLAEERDFVNQFQGLVALSASIRPDQWAKLVDGVRGFSEKGGERGDDYYNQLVGIWARTNPTAAAAYAAALDDGQAKENTRYQIYSRWAVTDPEGALTYAQSLTDPERQAALEDILQNVANDDPEKVWSVMQRFPEMEFDNWTYRNLFQQWTERDPEAATEAFFKDPPSTRNRAQILWQISSIYAEKDIDAAWEWATEIKNLSERDQAIRRVIEVSAENDLEQAMSLYDSLPVGAIQQQAAQQIAQAFARNDPEAGLEWIETLDVNAKSNALANLGNVWARAEPEKALSYLIPAVTEENRHALQNSIGNALGVWAENDFEAATGYALTITDNQLRNHAVGIFIQRQSYANPAKTANWLSSLGDEDLIIQNSGNIVSGWARNSPGDAARWLSAQNETAQERAVGSLIGNWANRDPNAAGTYVNSLPAGPVRDRAAQTFAQSISRYDPLTALDWASTLPDEKKLREKTTENVVRQWQRTEKRAADAWIESSDLPDEVKDRLLGRKNQG